LNFVQNIKCIENWCTRFFTTTKDNKSHIDLEKDEEYEIKDDANSNSSDSYKEDKGIDLQSRSSSKSSVKNFVENLITQVISVKNITDNECDNHYSSG
jgi:hypothetical protein